MGLLCLLGITGCFFDKSGLPYSSHGDAAVTPDGDAYTPVCGNGTMDQGEDCDGAELGGLGCEDVGFEDGELTCTTGCVFNTVGCTICGNGQQEGSEHCDGGDLAEQTCQTLSFDGGSLTCGSNCQFDTSQCTGAGCGDGTIGAGEQCDGGNLDGQFCASLGLGFTGGTLLCGSTCQFDTSGCDTCGDGVQTGAEECDGADLDGVTCVTLLYDGGNLACTTGCAFDVSNCSTCGNDVVELGESCDGADLAGEECSTVGYTAGTLACGPSCGFDVSSCTSCGNDVQEAGEECDDGASNSNTTPDACREDCTDPVCGDGVCDSSDAGGVCEADCRVVVFADDFDGAWPNGWSTGDEYTEWNHYGKDTWEPADNEAHSGSNSLWCAGDGSNDYTYDNYMGAYAVHALDLSAAAGYAVYYDMWIWVHVAESDDWFAASYSTDGGGSWTGLGAFNGDTSGWQFQSYDISAAAGEPDVRIGLYFYSDDLASWEHGAYVDDVEVWYQM